MDETFSLTNISPQARDGVYIPMCGYNECYMVVGSMSLTLLCCLFEGCLLIYAPLSIVIRFCHLKFPSPSSHSSGRRGLQPGLLGTL